MTSVYGYSPFVHITRFDSEGNPGIEESGNPETLDSLNGGRRGG